ncbi:16S rRNA (cytosine(1402)-N(4))-methyltransferase [Candidatus Parcubacteria bacterium]|nr:16S rRNA (cytosine(1402)-N(4))-methyltransferase [Candidatus Parcubacteria bacterium]
MKSLHKPVLLNEVLEYLNPRAGQNFIDCTLGGGGHTMAILERIIPNGKILAIDLDKEIINKSKVESQKSKVSDNLILVNDNFANLEKIIAEHNFGSVDGIIVDFGFSSDQIENSERGFSFLRDGPLDMRYDKSQKSIKSKIKNII